MYWFSVRQIFEIGLKMGFDFVHQYLSLANEIYGDNFHMDCPFDWPFVIFVLQVSVAIISVDISQEIS